MDEMKYSPQESPSEIAKLVLTVKHDGQSNLHIGSVVLQQKKVEVKMNEAFTRFNLQWGMAFRDSVKQINYEIAEGFPLLDAESHEHVMEARIEGDRISMRLSAFCALENVIHYQSMGRVRLDPFDSVVFEE